MHNLISKALYSLTSRFSSEAVGWLALISTLGIWTAFSISLRAIAHAELKTMDVAIIRFLVPAILLLPFIPRHLPSIKKLGIRQAIMIAGGGLPFFILAALGGQLTSAAYVSVLIAGTAPLTVALMAFLLTKERVSPRKVPGLCIIIGGVCLLVVGLGQFQQVYAIGCLPLAEC